MVIAIVAVYSQVAYKNSSGQTKVINYVFIRYQTNDFTDSSIKVSMKFKSGE